MAVKTAKDKFYGPLKVLETRSLNAMDFLDAEADTEHEFVWEFDEAERISSVAEAQTDLHKAVLEAGTCQALVGAFIDLLQEDYPKIKDSSCFFVGPDGRHVSLYEGQTPDL